eukprot:14830506-Heterocapsa_arctica.AAC.1
MRCHLPLPAVPALAGQGRHLQRTSAAQSRRPRLAPNSGNLHHLPRARPGSRPGRRRGGDVRVRGPAAARGPPGPPRRVQRAPGRTMGGLC